MGEARVAPGAARLGSNSPMVVAIETALAAVGFGICVVWAWRDGGFAPEEWLPGGLLLLAIFCTALASADVRRRLRARRTPLALFGLYVAWSYASLAWAQVPADALDGANRTLVYWLAFALFTGLGLSERRGAALILAWGTGIAALGLVALVEAGTAAAPAGHFVQGRLAAPLSYPDGDAALFLSACLALLVLASRPREHPASRLLAATAAVVLADLAVLCQSRGSLVALACVLAVYLVVARRRLRAIAYLGLAAISVAPAIPALLRVFTAVVTGHARAHAVRDAGIWIAVSAAVALVGMSLLVLFDRHVTLSARTRTAVGGAVAILGVATAVSALALALSAHPVGRAERAWHDFTTNQAASPTTLHFAAGTGTSRYDVWRIALQQFLAHPLTGVGADNFIVGYLQHRRTSQTSRYPESVELRTLSETGIVGAALFLGFLTLAFWQAVRAARRPPSPGLRLACLMGCTYWLFHASIDWFWELPALTGAALALLAVASAPAPAPSEMSQSTRTLSVSLKAIIAGAAVLLSAVLAIPWASVSLIDAAVAQGPGRSAYSLLSTAASLNPYSEQPALAEATLAASADELTREQHALRQALSRNPHDWYPYFMLGIVAGRDHHRAFAKAELERAHRLSPHDLVIVYAQRRLKWGEPLTQRQVARIFREVTSTLRGVRQG